MVASLRALLNQVLDYAGLFPPAKLPLDEALRTYLHNKKTSPHRWMLGRFVCPTPRLHELLTHAQGKDGADLLTVSALGQTAAGAKDFLTTLENDLTAIANFREAWGQRTDIDTIEFALPGGVEFDQLASHLCVADAWMQEASVSSFVEIPPSPSWQRDVERAAEVLRESSFGLKLRAGGLAAEAFPSDARVAFFIDRCRAADIPWKATAGLHHPRRFWDVKLNVWHHGFLNVFVAGLLARVHALPQSTLTEILADREGKHFRFTDKELAWKDWAVPLKSIEMYRRDFATTFGSCSFDEPIDDLRHIGLLDAGA